MEILRSAIFWKRQISRFRNPDSWGVSVNYISQRSRLLNSLEELQNTEFYIDSSLLKEGLRIAEQLAKKISDSDFPEIWNIELKLASYLYSYIMQEKPLIVVETGVANGFSTRVMMAALEQTGGSLHSFDVRGECRSVYRGIGKWTFHHVPRKNQMNFLQKNTSNLVVNFWFHDSDHSYLWQKFEYELAISRLALNGLLISDDIDTSEAWIEFCEKEKMLNISVFDSRKIFGLAKRPAQF